MLVIECPTWGREADVGRWPKTPDLIGFPHPRILSFIAEYCVPTVNVGFDFRRIERWCDFQRTQVALYLSVVQHMIPGMRASCDVVLGECVHTLPRDHRRLSTGFRSVLFYQFQLPASMKFYMFGHYRNGLVDMVFGYSGSFGFPVSKHCLKFWPCLLVLARMASLTKQNPPDFSSGGFLFLGAGSRTWPDCSCLGELPARPLSCSRWWSRRCRISGRCRCEPL